MNKENLREVYDAIEITGKDVRTVRCAKFKEFVIYPIFGGIATGLSALLGWFGGKDDEKLVNRETGSTYPYSGGVPSGVASFFGFIISISGAIVATISLLRTKQRVKWKMIVAWTITIITSIVLSIYAYKEMYNMSRPIQYYSGAIDYGVYSTKEGCQHEKDEYT